MSLHLCQGDSQEGRSMVSKLDKLGTAFGEVKFDMLGIMYPKMGTIQGVLVVKFYD